MKFYWKQYVFIPLIIAGLIYVAFGVYMYLNQRNILYFPDETVFDECEAFADYEKRHMDDTRFYFKERSADEVFVYYHGNTGSACDRARTTGVLEEATDASMIFVEYAGYSADDPREPSRDFILEDVRTVWTFINERNFEQVTVYGQSIGSGAASYHASLGNVDRLVLVSAFVDAETVARAKFPLLPVGWILEEQYPNADWLRDYDGEVFFAHGEEDQVIPQVYSKQLYDQLQTDTKTYELFEDVGHIDIWTSDTFRAALVAFLRR